jgi:phosphatidylglycerophosphate synthase
MKATTPLPRGNIYVTGPSLLNLKNDYKYTGADKSVIAARMQKFWNWAVLWIPEWMAPNMVTLLGLGFIIASFLVNFYYTPFLIGECPRWVYLFHAACVFIYQTLDALDGKHARRTGNSSPLGELFDHGCDAVTTTLMVLGVVSVIQLGPSWEAAWNIILANCVFFCAQWEQYTVGTLTLGEVNVTEAQFVTMALYVFTAIVGPNFWLQTFTVAGYTLKYHHPLIIVNSLIIASTIFTNFVNVAKTIS